MATILVLLHPKNKIVREYHMPHKILTIAGSDSLAGGGIQADLATFANYGHFGLSVITAIVTITPTDFEIYPVDLKIIEAQLKSVLSLDDIVAVKVGLLPTPEIINLVTSYLAQINVPIVVDPVMVFKETDQINIKSIADTLKTQLLPLATIVTPNLNEAQILANQRIDSVDDMKQAATTIAQYGCKNIVVKGGSKFPGNEAIDLLFDREAFYIFQQDKIKTSELYHNGAGCTLSAGLAANLGYSLDMIHALKDAKDFVWQGIQNGVTLNSKFSDGNVWQGARRNNHETKI